MDHDQLPSPSSNELHPTTAGSLEDELAHAHRRAQRLERQNARLRLLLDTFISGRDASQADGTPDARLYMSPTELTPAPHPTYKDAGTCTDLQGQLKDLPLRYEKLQRDYNLMARQANFFRQSFERRDQKYRAQKELLKDWTRWRDADKRRQPRAARPHVSEDGDVRSGSSTTRSRASAPAALHVPAPTAESKHSSSASPRRAADEALPTLSSQETVDENTDMQPPSAADDIQHHSSDGFEIVSERQVRSAARQAKQDATRLDSADASGDLAYSQRVKEESASPPAVPALLQSYSHQSCDLDEISGQVETPSKRRRTRDIMCQDIGEIQRPGSGIASPVWRPLSDDLNQAAQLSGARKRPAVKIKGDEDEATHGFVKPQPVSGQSHGRPKTTVLQPVSANERRLPKRKEPENCDVQIDSACVPGDIKDLAEDRETISGPNTTAKSLPSTTLVGNSNKRRKTDQLLSEPNANSPATVSMLPQLVKDRPYRSVRSSAQFKKPVIPLRKLPLAELGLDDFRPNPKGPSSNGLDYAFTETVRGREARQCLPGCSDPRCCGSKFAKMVAIGGVAPKIAQSLWSTESRDAPDAHHERRLEDQRLLDHFIGRDTAAQRRISAMTRAERTRALVDARAALLAEQHGKHRQAFQRRSSPPGFWRTDMPSTQELEQDRAAQETLTRQRVRERWEEATRGGQQARWVFRDESRK